MAQKIFTYKPQPKRDSKFLFLIFFFGSQIFSSIFTFFQQLCSKMADRFNPIWYSKLPPKFFKRNFFILIKRIKQKNESYINKLCFVLQILPKSLKKMKYIPIFI